MMQPLIALSLLVLCVLAQNVLADGYNGVKITKDNCEDWHGPGGCDASCHAPKHRCCVSYEPTCLPHCSSYSGYCVHDPDFCVIQPKHVCEIVPKKVCTVKPVCEKVKHKVCDDVDENKCDYVDDQKCEDVKKCIKVPKCGWKKECDHDDSKSHFLIWHHLHHHIKARTKKCRKVYVCHDEEKCTTDKICTPYHHEVCTKVPVKKCYDDDKTVCTNKESCITVEKEMCVVKKEKLCKEKVKCSDEHCDWGQKCNPDCCRLKKIPFCLSLGWQGETVTTLHG